jgi:Tol biopolymer transport system component
MARNALAAVLVVTIGATAGVSVFGNLSEHQAAQRPAANDEQGDVIAYVSDRDGDTDIYTTSLDGEGAVNLTDNDASEASPTWAPDGSRIAFSSDRSGIWDLYVMNADGSGVTRLLGDGTDPDWSPDGSTIAFQRAGAAQEGHGLSQIYVMDLSTGGVDQATRDAAGALQASWSPDGTLLAYSGQQARIVVSAPDGSKTERVTDEYGDMHPVWSPDGSTLLFSRETSFANDTSLSNVFEVGVSGGAARRLTNKSESVVPESFSPDGGRVLVTIYDDRGNGDIYAMDGSGSHLTPVVEGSSDDGEPEWRP